uniref:Predicted protein n=1 Tax=Hordeum vulgare subsp. vulgare TaxID=112509 RepID=F2DV39_HORVV|nr:predicted protein [Hordeum vulgare subsp. vulgare]
MGKFNKILNGLIKALVVVVGLAIAVVPVIYIFAHEPQTTLPWREELGKFADRTDQLALLSLSPISNFYLRPQKSKLSWSDVNATLQLADYL